MDLLRNLDWCSTEPDVYFINELDLDHSNTEKILRNKFSDPLISSSSEDESLPTKLNWDEIFKKNRARKEFAYVVQGAHPPPPYIKLSALTSDQHFQCLKVLCSQNPDVIPGQYFPRPTKFDQKVFEEVKETYVKEQKEFIEWAKFLWVSNHCARALRPKPAIELVYDAEFQVRAKAIQSFPKNYTMAAQIPLESPTSKCEIVHQKEIIKVNLTALPQLQYPDMTKRTVIMRPCPVPEPCNKHPTRFVLPLDTATTLLPLKEVHGELAQFAFDNGARNIASESALRCLVQEDRHWTLPVSVCRAYSADGENCNVVVLGSEFAMKRDPAVVRTYKAYRRLLDYALTIPDTKHGNKREASSDEMEDVCELAQDLDLTLSDGEDSDGLIIDTDFLSEDDDTSAKSACLTSPKSSGSAELHVGGAKDNSETDELSTQATTRRVTRQSSRDPDANKIGHSTKRKDLFSNADETPAKSPKSPGRTKDDPETDNLSTQPRNRRVTRQSSRDAEVNKMNFYASSPKDVDEPPKSASLTSPKKQGNAESHVGGAKDDTDPHDPSAQPTKRVTRQNSREPELNKMDFYTCTCKDTMFETPTPRSFRRWRARSYVDWHDLVVHTPHRFRGKSGEVVLEPVVEYQLDCGASEVPRDQVRGAALALLLRRGASVLHVRIDYSTGDIVKTEPMYPEALNKQLLEVVDSIANRVHTTLGQLQGLLPGRYLLYHEPSHGPNALLYASAGPVGGQVGDQAGGPTRLTLALDGGRLGDADEAHAVKRPPTLAPVLLPMHKYRRTLPLAFTTNPHFVAKEPKKPPTRNKTPPSALQPGEQAGGAQRKWPKRKKKRKNPTSNTQ